MKGQWVDTGFGGEFVFKSPDGTHHARVYRDDNVALFGSVTWVVWTYHTEGNDRYATTEAAMQRGEERLKRLLDATESLR